MQVGAGHGEMLPLSQWAGGSQQTWNGAGKMAQQAVFFTETLHHVVHVIDTHFFE